LIVWLYKINDKIRAYSIISKILVQLQKNTALLSELLSVILYQKQLFSIWKVKKSPTYSLRRWSYRLYRKSVFFNPGWRNISIHVAGRNNNSQWQKWL